MRVLVLSETIERSQRWNDVKYSAPHDITLDVADPNTADGLSQSIFDYDVSIVHITKPRYNTIGYFENLPKILNDSIIALEHGRTVICLPGCEDFQSERVNRRGMHAYEWVKKLGIPLNDNSGVNIRPSQAGLRSRVFQDYLGVTPSYYQIVKLENPKPDEILAVVDDTQIIVGISHNVGKGKMVVLPPAIFHGDSYLPSMWRLIDLARHYFEVARRNVPIFDAPDWVQRLLVPEAKRLIAEIERLQIEKSRFDLIAYVLYGTGKELEESVKAICEDLGLQVERQPSGANVDLKAKHSKLGLGFTVEVTGTKGIIRKDSNKVSQCWQHINDRVGTPEADDRLVVLANTECHLDPTARKPDSFTREVVDLLSSNGVLLLTSVQLYDLWKDVHEGKSSHEDIIRRLHKSSGPFVSPTNLV